MASFCSLLLFAFFPFPERARLCLIAPRVVRLTTYEGCFLSVDRYEQRRTFLKLNPDVFIITGNVMDLTVPRSFFR